MSMKSKCLDIYLIFKSQNIVSDFEKEILQVASKEFMNTTLIGCRFHLHQAWWRKFMKLGQSSNTKIRIRKSENGSTTFSD